MRKLACLMGLLLLVGVSAKAQDTSKAEVGDFPQTREIDFGVDAGGFQVPMPQLIGDGFEGDAAVDESCGTGVAQSMRTVMHDGEMEGLHAAIN